MILTVAGCSSDSDKGSGSGDEKKKSGSSASSSAAPGGDKPSAAPTLEKAAFDKLPEPCKVIQAKTIETLVPEVKDKNGTATKSNDLASRGG